MLELFGGSKGWYVDDWFPVNDQVRGGSSTSFLALVNASVRFHGHLDTSTLGGAGFASQKTIISWDLSEFQGLIIKVESSDAMKYSFNFKNPDRDIEYRYSFQSQLLPFTLVIPWDRFLPTYRGRDLPNAQKFDPSSISSLSIMCASYFDQQKGDFSIILGSIAAY